VQFTIGVAQHWNGDAFGVVATGNANHGFEPDADRLRGVRKPRAGRP
jgi:hypothetical protein